VRAWGDGFKMVSDPSSQETKTLAASTTTLTIEPRRLIMR